MISFGFIAKIKDNTAFIITAFLLRVLQGVADSLVTTIGLAIVNVTYTHNRESYLGKFEAAAGLGYTLGPIIGSVIYDKLGFLATFTMVGA